MYFYVLTNIWTPTLKIQYHLQSLKKKKKTQKYLGVNLTIYKRGLCTESYTVVVEKNWKRAKINEEIHYIHRLNDSTW